MSHHHSDDHPHSNAHGHSHNHQHGHQHGHPHEHEHEHTHEHSHAHTHDHGHHHGADTPPCSSAETASGHSHDVVSSLSFEEKLIKLLSHWIKHNDDHAGTYVDWAAKTSAAGLPAIEALLTEAADMTRSISTRFDTALKQLEKGKP